MQKKTNVGGQLLAILVTDESILCEYVFILLKDLAASQLFLYLCQVRSSDHSQIKVLLLRQLEDGLFDARLNLLLINKQPPVMECRTVIEIILNE